MRPSLPRPLRGSADVGGGSGIVDEREVKHDGLRGLRELGDVDRLFDGGKVREAGLERYEDVVAQPRDGHGIGARVPGVSNAISSGVRASFQVVGVT